LASITTPILLGLALFLPINGYMLAVLKNSRDGQTVNLPEWDDIGGLFATGWRVLVIQIVYHIPALLLACPAIALAIAPGFVDIDPDLVTTLTTTSTLLNACIVPLLSILGTAIYPAALIRYAETDRLGAAFEFGAVFRFISNNIGNYLIVFLLVMVGGTIATFGLIFCFVGIFFTHFWLLLVSANFYGQLAKEAV
ncbi:MAG: DUF4013 domain-containing protein, partial [Chloroflexota bacterium]